MNKYVIDTNAWIEYLFATDKGRSVHDVVSDMRNQCLTIECTLGELKCWALKIDADFARILNIVESQSNVIPVEQTDWLFAADLRQEMRRTRKDFGLIDAVILVKQRVNKCTLVSGDSDFQGLPNVLFLD